MKKFIVPKDKIYKITNIGKLVTGTNQGSLKIKEKVEILIDNGKIKKIDTKISTPENIPTLNANSCMITPSFVDPHTHLFPPTGRAGEFALRPIKSYQEIAAEGGGILSSVRAVREASLESICNTNLQHLSRFYLNGTTTVEIKSGYGLSTQEELKLLRAIKHLKLTLKDRITIIPTFLGAHAVPPEFKGKTDEYVDLIVNEMIPEVAKEQLAEFVDVFCEKGYFNTEQTRKIIVKALEHGLKIKLHADEFVDSGAAELAGLYGACSADHLMAVSDKGIEALKSGNVVATILPGTTVFLGKTSFAPARKLIDSGCLVALATDFNPGSSVFQSQPLMMNYAMNFTKMTVEESFLAVTRNAALALNRKNLGIIEEDCDADLIIWDKYFNDISQIPYFNVESSKYINAIVKSGNVDYLNSEHKEIFSQYSEITYDESYSKIVEAISTTCEFDEDNLICNIPERVPLNPNIDHAPKRSHTLDEKGKELAITNALKYFNKKLHSELTPIFKKELEEYGHIYMFNYLPKVSLEAVPVECIPGKNKTTKSIIHMILNNLDPQVAQFPEEMITYGGNGAVFSNWAQFHLTMKYLMSMNENECLPMYSGHPSGLFPKLDSNGPSAVICNGMVIPNYSDKTNFDNMYALGVTMYGQMTAGSWMYIGPQGIVHGTTLTVAQAAAIQDPQNPSVVGKIFVTSGLGGMSGAQPKAMKILGGICLVAEFNAKALNKRHSQGWLDEKYENLDELIKRAKIAQKNKEAISIGYLGNIVDLWERLAIEDDLEIHLGSDQTSLHNPFNGGYYPCGLSFEEAQDLMTNDKEAFKLKIEETLRRHVAAVNKCVEKKNMFFWDYGNAFLLQAERAHADIKKDGKHRYLSYVDNIMGPQFFDFGFGPYRWICTSKDKKDLIKTDRIAESVIRDQLRTSIPEIKNQLESNLKWIVTAEENQLTVGSMARILYSDTVGRVEMALRMNEAIRNGEIKGTIVIGRDHHDVSGTDSPYRETANIYDGSNLTADMAFHNVIGDAMRGASWVSIHNGGGVGWGEVINGGFGLVLDGSDQAAKRAKSMLFWDVTNGLVRRARAGNKNAILTVTNLKNAYPEFKPFIPSMNLH